MALLPWSRIRTVHALLFGGDENGNALRLFADHHGGGLRVIDQSHVKTHEGDLYLAGHLFSLGSAADGEVIITTGATKEIHLSVGVSAGAGGRFFVFEAPTFTVGTPITPINANRQSANTAEPTVVYTPTVTVDGTALSSEVVPGGTTGAATGGANRGFARGVEYILKASTSYLFRFTNDGAGTEYASISLGFYED